MFEGYGVVGDEPALIALEVVFQGVTDVFVDLVDVVLLETVAVRRVDDHDASVFGRSQVFHVLFHQVDVVLEVGVGDVAFGDGHGLGRAVRSPDLMVELADLIVGFLLDAFPQFRVPVVPFHEAPLTAIVSCRDLHGEHGRFDGQGA